MDKNYIRINIEGKVIEINLQDEVDRVIANRITPEMSANKIGKTVEKSAFDKLSEIDNRA